MSDNEDTLTTVEPDTGSTQDSEPVATTTEAPVPETAPADATVQDDSQAKASPSNQADPATLTTSQSQTQDKPQTQPQTQPTESLEQRYQTLEKRWRDQQSFHDRQINQWKERMESQGKEMDSLQRYRAEQEQRAKAANLKRYNKDHPEHSQFLSVLQRRDMASSQLQALNQRNDLTPEQKSAMAEIIRGPLTDDELREVKEYEEYGRNFQRSLATDPRSALAPIIRDEFRAMFQEEQQKAQAQFSVQKDFNDPKMKPLIEAHGQEFAKALQDNVPYEYAKHMMGMYAELQQLREQVKTADVKTSAADERIRLAKGEASITRDPKVPAQDPYQKAKAEARKEGVPLDSPRFAQILAKHTT